MLISRGRADDRSRAEAFQVEARETAARLAIELRHETEPRAHRGTLSSAVVSSVHEHGHTLAREGEYWTFDYRGTISRLRDRTGVSYLARLLERPHEPLPALLLAAAVEGDGDRTPASARRELPVRVVADLGEVLDERARAEYRARASELRAELDEAEQRHDLGRAERLRHEIAMLDEMLGAALGLGGRPRRAGSPAERARLNVTRALHGAIERVQALDGRLGAHLVRSVRTGTYCSYAPPEPTRWTVLRAWTA